MKFCGLIELLQEKDKGYIILINSGGFYIAIGKDAILLNRILDLKLSCMRKNICKVGFPKSSLEKYQKLIKRNRYSYKIYNFDRENNRLDVIQKYDGTLKNEIENQKRDCYLCKNELGGYTEKEDKFIQAIAELRRRESDERKQINIDTKN